MHWCHVRAKSHASFMAASGSCAMMRVVSSCAQVKAFISDAYMTTMLACWRVRAMAQTAQKPGQTNLQPTALTPHECGRRFLWVGVSYDM